MEKVKLELLDRFNRKNPGDVVEVRQSEAKVLKALGKAKDYVEKTSARTRGTTTTRVMEPQKEPEVTTEATSEVENTPETETQPASIFGRYSRRDMKPEE